MTDEKLIIDYLNKNYEVRTDVLNFVFFDKIDGKTYEVNNFKKHFLTIFGEFDIDKDNTSITTMFRWFSLQKRVVTKKLYDTIDTLDKTERSQKQLNKLIKFYKNRLDVTYHETFIKNIFIEHYKETYFKPKLDDYISSFNADLGSIKLIDDFQDEFILEHHQIISYAKDYLNSWYSETIIGDKVKDFLSQLVITLGPRNWVITWVGHGQFSKSILLKNFMNESGFHHKFIIDMFDKWYDDSITEASERVMRNTEPNWRLTNN